MCLTMIICPNEPLSNDRYRILVFATLIVNNIIEIGMGCPSAHKKPAVTGKLN